MCGIVGVINLHESRPIRGGSRAVDAIRHRGPDGEGFAFLDEGGKLTAAGGPDTPHDLGLAPAAPLFDRPWRAMLAHRRLSIIDLSSLGHQPMLSPDGACLMFNGEIYNYLELRRELESEGRQFRSTSDTEVLLALLERRGEAALASLTGMFALAFYDPCTRSILLARDAFGIKPFYYLQTEEQFVFASEIRCLLEHIGQPRLNPQAAFDYLRYGWSDHGEQTMFAGIKQLEPAHSVRVSLDSGSVGTPTRYWNPQAPVRGFRTTDSHYLLELLERTVALHSRSDVPIGSCLSGGVDSSLIVLLLRKLLGRDADLHTFSFISTDDRMSEERFIDAVSASAASVQHKVKPTAEEFVADLDSLIRLQEIPFASTSIYCQYRVFKLISKAGVKVILDGQGADEEFCGYASAHPILISSLFRKGDFSGIARLLGRGSHLPTHAVVIAMAKVALCALPRPISTALLQATGRQRIPSWLNIRWVQQNELGSEMPLAETDPSAYRSRTCTHILSSLLRYEDRNSMHFSIESRVPYLTQEIFQFAQSLSVQNLWSKNGGSKMPLREAGKALLPSIVANRWEKVGFESPEAGWLQSAGRNPTCALFNQDALSEVPMLNSKVIQEIWTGFIDTNRPYSSEFWRWINFLKWVEIFNVKAQ